MRPRKTIAASLDSLGLAVGNSGLRTKFYNHLSDLGFLFRNGSGFKEPTGLAVEKGVATSVSTKEYVVWSLNFIYGLVGRNRCSFRMSDAHVSYFSKNQLCSSDYMTEPFGISELNALLAPYMNGNQPSEEAVQNEWARWHKGWAITNWNETKLKEIFDIFFEEHRPKETKRLARKKKKDGLKKYPVGVLVDVTFGRKILDSCEVLGHKLRGEQFCMIADISSRDQELFVLAETESGLGHFVCYCDRDGSNERATAYEPT